MFYRNQKMERGQCAMLEITRKNNYSNMIYLNVRSKDGCNSYQTRKCNLFTQRRQLTRIHAFQIELEIGQSMACFLRRREDQSRLRQGGGGGGRRLLEKNNMKNREENQEQKWVCYICKMKKCRKKSSLLLYLNNTHCLFSINKYAFFCRTSRSRVI